MVTGMKQKFEELKACLNEKFQVQNHSISEVAKDTCLKYLCFKTLKFSLNEEKTIK